MTMQVFWPVIQVVLVVAGVIAALRIFFTLWGPVDRRMNPDKHAHLENASLGELKDKTVTVHFQSGEILQDVVLVGVCSNRKGLPFDFAELLMARGQDQKTYYIRMHDVQYLEERKA